MAFTDPYRRHRFAILFYSLLLTIGASPFIRTLRLDLLDALLTLNLVVAAIGATTGRTLYALLALAAVFGGIRAAALASGTRALLGTSEATWIVVSMVAVVATLRHALRRGPVDGERIFAALSVYILTGLVFGMGYWLCEQAWPGSLSVASGSGELSFSRAVYFSFVTLASLGYGDIVPVSAPARGMAILEVIGGQMYLVVLVARLVSLYASQERHP
jgi:hypothetical protein